MKTSLVLTVIGTDRPGLVDGLAQTALAHGANWEASRMAHLGGRFAGLLLFTVDGDRADALEADLRRVQGLQVVIERALDSPDDEPRKQLRLEVVGQDRRGIIHDISHALAERKINVDELSTECTSAPMAGGTLFEMVASLSCPPSVSVDELREVIEELASDLMVTIDDEMDGGESG